MTSSFLPRFSIVIPTYDRPDQLRRCLEAVDRLDYPRESYEVIVVDDGTPLINGESATEEVVALFQGQMTLKFITQNHAGPAVARNTGGFQATGEFLAFTDDDCSPNANWLTEFASRLVEAPDALIGGRVINALPGNIFSTASQSLVDYLYYYYNVHTQPPCFFTSNNIAVSVAAFRAVGGFDPQFVLTAGEDRELCDRWCGSGRSTVYAPEAIIHHAHELSLRKFWRQHFGYGRGAVHFHLARSRRKSQPVRIEPPAFYLKMLSYPFTGKARPRRALRLSSLFIVAQIANVVGYFYERQRRGSGIVPQENA